MIEVDPDEGSCEICGSSEGVARYWLNSEVVLRCEKHADGIDLAADRIYWRRRSSSEGESNSEEGIQE